MKHQDDIEKMIEEGVEKYKKNVPSELLSDITMNIASELLRLNTEGGASGPAMIAGITDVVGMGVTSALLSVLGAAPDKETAAKTMLRTGIAIGLAGAGAAHKIEVEDADRPDGMLQRKVWLLDENGEHAAEPMFEMVCVQGAADKENLN